ncbi:hypothetical protein [Flavobacterium sp. GSB-24]|uniref:hypothetical protein n=1 Tax=Flavobacterium sp. GSB-24 TaxID=2994319 RepID=UPI0024908AA5|nr:hypothetical protein [Flavobacterium sp. GSB-24]BDU25105.1 hypothetical protein FLGSB24_18490 [Flavobacterium sp. GSB-24]
MENAVILKTGKVVRKSSFVPGSLKIDLQGFVDQFAIGKPDKIYKHVNKDKFNLRDLNGYDKPISAGYYLESQFLKYIANIITIEKLNESVLKDADIIFAKDGDEIEVFRLHIEAPYNFFYKLEKFNIIYKRNIPVLDSNQNIITPNDKEPVIINFDKATITSKQFYNKRIYIANAFNVTKEKDSAAFLITKIAIMINKIEREIFPLFAQNNDLISYINNQIIEWLSDEILINPSLETLAEFNQNITDYYKVAYSNQLKILESSGTEKLYWLAMGLSSQSLSGLPVNEKWKILHYLIKNKLSNNLERIKEEELVINIVYSFNQSNIKEIDQFLSFFLYPYETGTEKETTFYEVLYNSMSTSTNMKQGLLGLSNWVLGTEYQPTTTKGQFVMAIYMLWQFSKYNPYDNNDKLKNATIDFRSSNSIASFAPENTNQSLFNYTHYVAYDPVYWSNSSQEIKEYKISRPNASPILMPYQSSKIIGIYFDNFNFSIDGNKIIAYQSLPVISSRSDENITLVEQNEVQYGIYDLFQPVTLLSTDIETRSALSTVNGQNISINGQNINSFIPLFVLSFIDKDGDSSDAESILGYVVDVATTFTGIGNLAKLKHLKWGASGLKAGEVALKSLEGLKIVVGGVEFTAGVLGFFANFVECSENDSFCQGMKTFIAVFQLACLTTNVGTGIASLIAKREAAKLLKIAGEGANDSETIANLKSKLQQLGSNASPEIIDEVSTRILSLGRLNSLPIDLIAIALYRKLKNTLLLAQNKLYRESAIILENTPLNEPAAFGKLPRFSLYKYVEDTPNKLWKRVTGGDVYLHTEAELQEMIDFGKSLEIDELTDIRFKNTNDVTEHFILKSFRTVKQKTKAEVIEQMRFYKTFLTEREKVPFCFSLLNDSKHFNDFKTEFLSILGKYYYGGNVKLLNYLDEYQISGSALYKVNPPDMDISGYIRRLHIRNLTAKNIELFEKNRAIIIKQLNKRRRFNDLEEIEKALYHSNTKDQINAFALLRIDSEGNIYTLAEDISNMANKPNTPKSTDFNVFDITKTDRRLQPDLTIKTK